MKSTLKSVCASLVITLFVAEASAVPAMHFRCKGIDTTNETPVTFLLDFADHDGEDYTYKALYDFVYGGKEAAEIDLTQTKVRCGKDDRGKVREGVQNWSLKDGIFELYSGCENEALEIKAVCELGY